MKTRPVFFAAIISCGFLFSGCIVSLAPKNWFTPVEVVSDTIQYVDLRVTTLQGQSQTHKPNVGVRVEMGLPGYIQNMGFGTTNEFGTFLIRMKVPRDPNNVGVTAKAYAQSTAYCGESVAEKVSKDAATVYLDIPVHDCGGSRSSSPARRPGY